MKTSGQVKKVARKKTTKPVEVSESLSERIARMFPEPEPVEAKVVSEPPSGLKRVGVVVAMDDGKAVHFAEGSEWRWKNEVGVGTVLEIVAGGKVVFQSHCYKVQSVGGPAWVSPLVVSQLYGNE